MSDFPYTTEQVERAHEAAHRNVDLDIADINEVLRGFHAAGITVTFPEPRFYVAQRGSRCWDVIDRRGEHVAASFFRNNSDSERHAREHSDRLNREVGA